jgi:hypothetical protein
MSQENVEFTPAARLGRERSASRWRAACLVSRRPYGQVTGLSGVPSLSPITSTVQPPCAFREGVAVVAGDGGGVVVAKGSDADAHQTLKHAPGSRVSNAIGPRTKTFDIAHGTFPRRGGWVTE